MMSAMREQPVALPTDIPDTLTKAGYTLASHSPRSKHSQRCPVWEDRRNDADISQCNCWILQRARDDARIVAAVLLPSVYIEVQP